MGKNNFYIKIFFIVFFITTNIYPEKVNPLVKAFQHFGIFEDKIVFYFKNDQPIKLISQRNNQSGSLAKEIYLFPNSIIYDDSIKEIINKINDSQHPFYKIYISSSDKFNIKLTIIYDPKFVKKITPLVFNAISLFKGVAFNIDHKNVKDFFDYKNPVGSITDYSKPNIILDFGHGGNDAGAISENGICEKEITYKVGLKLKKLLELKKFNVFLTRASDKFVGLDERTSMSNFLPGAIFVSIHANFSPNKNASGMETFYSDFTLLNEYNFKNEMLTILPLKKRILDGKNKILATILHDNLLSSMRIFNPNLVDRKVKKSVSQVLLGTEMPSVLVELGFLSHKIECDLLNSEKYQNSIAQGMCNGICIYSNTM